MNGGLIQLKKIHLMPYAHCDYAWTNTREWHLWRYIEGFRQVLDIMKNDENFTFLIDNVAQTGKIISEYIPERLDEVRDYVKNGRICIANGGIELLRPAQNGGELFIRNMVMGKNRLAEFYGINEIPVFFNADSAIGHSQMPQLLKLCGHSAYYFMRPNDALDNAGIPAVFVWNGLDGSKVTVSRGRYVGLSGNYMAGDRSVQMNGFYKNEVKPRLEIQPVDEILIFAGGDDSLPMNTVFDVPVDFNGFITDWNKMGNAKMEYSTINKYFKNISGRKLPVIEGTIDSCELSYCITAKRVQSLWQKS